MHIFFKMPTKIGKLAKIFLSLGNNLLRDYHEMLGIAQKSRFVKQSNLNFYKSIDDFILKEYQRLKSFEVFKEMQKNIEVTDEDLDTQYLETERKKYFIDGLNNFKYGISLFTLTYVEDNYLLVYEPMTSNFYWGDKTDFFINDLKCNSKTENQEIEVVKDDFVPTSLKIVWQKIGAIKSFETNDERFKDSAFILDK